MPDTPIYCPQRPLPPYTYVPGRTPHPTRDPGGHLHGKAPQIVARPDPRRWTKCYPYLHGIDLFNRGYYWEAHEAWESVWHACGRRGVTADFLRALIRLAAAGFKARQGQPRGVRRHAEAADRLLATIEANVGGARGRYMGLDPGELRGFAQRIVLEPLPEPRGNPPGVDAPVEPVFDYPLRPRD